MSQFANVALIAIALWGGAAQAQAQTPTTPRTRAEVIAELKAAVESGEQQAMALQMEGVGFVMPKAIDRSATLSAGKSKASKKKADTAETRATL